MTALDLKVLRQWIGRSARCTDVVTPRLAAALRATLDISDAASTSVPAAVHWCLAPQIERTADLGPDGHLARGAFLPPVCLPRRMWAGGELVFHDALRIGDEVLRESLVADVTLKAGRTGPLCFVTVDHVFISGRGLAISERQDIVYRDYATNGEPKPRPKRAPCDAQWRRELKPDSVLLFRYSALTFNSHRIHYDRSYCRDQEGYRGLVVQGPLQASYLLELAVSIRGRVPRLFTFRTIAPLFDAEVMSLNALECESGLQLWVANQNDELSVEATALW